MSTTFTPPTIAQLTDRFLSTEQGFDLGTAEVELHEMLNGFRIDPRTAFVDSLAALKILGETNLPLALPPDWAAFVQTSTDCYAVPMSAGSFPQRVRELTTLLNAEDLNSLRPKAPVEMSGFVALRNWAVKTRQQSGTKWLAASLLRSFGEGHSDAIDANDPIALNEMAAAHWQAGDAKTALQIWNAMPDSPTAAFNRGMALLFTGDAEAAIPHLKVAASQLPDTSGWNHLAQLYVAVAEAQ